MAILGSVSNAKRLLGADQNDGRFVIAHQGRLRQLSWQRLSGRQQSQFGCFASPAPRINPGCLANVPVVPLAKSLDRRLGGADPAC